MKKFLIRRLSPKKLFMNWVQMKVKSLMHSPLLRTSTRLYLRREEMSISDKMINEQIIRKSWWFIWHYLMS